VFVDTVEFLNTYNTRFFHLIKNLSRGVKGVKMSNFLQLKRISSENIASHYFASRYLLKIANVSIASAPGNST